ncbi:MAG: TonB-dependent receptor [Melioribacteraceae bacterium]|nr:TonB-dependent receptor [Melioribacteraceae bacterium]
MLYNNITAKKMIKCFLITLFLAAQVYAQNGKITGTVYDAVTNETLIGVNVFLEGTTVGSATDEKGRFIILNVTPGKYNVVASMISYGKVVQKGVVVNIDRTTELEFELQDESVQMDQVIITAKKKAIIKDRTATATNIDDEQIKAAPIEGLRGALDLSAGFQKNEKGDYSIRGSGSHEVNFQINGVEQTNSNTSVPGSFGAEKANNSWKYDVNPLGVAQLQMISGGFNAEYGNAQAGVVKVVLKDGGPKFNGEFRVEYRPSGQYHYGDYIYSKNNFEWQKWGNLNSWISDENREFLITDLKLDDKYGHLKNSDPEEYERLITRDLTWAHDVWVDNHEPSDDNPLGVYDYRDESYTRYLFGFGGPLGKDHNLLKFYISGEYKKNPTRLPTPEKNQITQNYILNVTYKPAIKHKIKAMVSYQDYVGGIWSGSSDIRWSGLAFTPPGVSKKYLVNFDPVREEQTVAQSINWVYTINNNSFAEATVSHQNEKYELPYKYLPGFGMEIDRLDSLNDPMGTILKDGIWWEKDYFFPPQSFSTNYYQDQRTENFAVKIDYSNQMNQTNFIKTGLSFTYWDMFSNGVNSSFQANSLVARNGFAEYYKAYPFNFAAYFQDKMEYEGMIANIGLRAEVYNFQAKVPVDKHSVLYTGIDGPPELGNEETKESELQYILLPRVGVSFPIGENTAFRFYYGHFASMPIFSQALSNRTSRGWSGIGNPNLNPKKTINYEFGLQQVIDDNHRLDAVLYYNDRATQIGTQKMVSYTGSTFQTAGFSGDNTPLYYYNTYANNAFGSTVGFELTFESIKSVNWAYRLSYSISQTTTGNYGSEYIYPDDSREFSERTFTGEFIASWDRTHNLRGLLQYSVSEGEGFELWGFKPFENSVFSFTYSAQSGIPYTYITEFSQVKDVVRNKRYPIESNADFNFTKDIRIDDVKVIFGVRVMNLFDNKWLTPMSQSEDIRNWVEDGITVADAGNDPGRLAYAVAPYTAYRNIPRQVFFTLGIGF